jgi:hypothetical protein
MLPYLVHKMFTFYINGVLNCKCPAPGPKGQIATQFARHCRGILAAAGQFDTAV